MRKFPALKKDVLDLTFESINTAPQARAICKTLINEIVNKQIESQIDVVTISELLRRRCPTYCSPDDIVYYKGIESLRKAKSGFSPSERESLLQDSFSYALIILF